jgi:predicted transcriptional regulator
VRPYRDPDDGYVRRTLVELDQSWLLERMRETTVSVTIGELEGEPAALAFSETRDKTTVELILFYVEERATATDLDGHLLFHLVRGWIVHGYETARVTLPMNPRLVKQLRDAGFLATGFRRSLSDPKMDEIQFVKYIERERLDESNYQTFTERLGRLFSPPGDLPALSKHDSWLLPPLLEPVRALFNADTGDITIAPARQGPQRKFSPADLEIIFYPLRVAVHRRALIIPIQPVWAARMMAYEGRQEQLFGQADNALLIRSDNAYYCYPKCENEVLARSPIVFYVSRPVSACVGEAKIVQSAVDLPDVLYALFGGIGAYDLGQVRKHQRAGGILAGRALALRFSHYVPFPTPVRLNELRRILGQNRMTPQGLHPVSIDVYERIRSSGGLTW